MMSDAGPIALVSLLLPALSFLVLALVVPLRRSGRPAAWFSIACMAGSLAAAVLAWRAVATTAEIRLTWEWLPAQGQALATVGVLVDARLDDHAHARRARGVARPGVLGGLSQRRAAAGLGRYYTYQSLFAFSMMGLVLAPNFVQLFICWELVGLCSYLLIGYWYWKPEAARAAVKAFWVTKAGDVGLLIGIVLLWRHSGTFDLTDMRGLAASGALPLAGLSFITFCMYLGAMGKSAQFPLHVWLPDAMEGPTPVSALIHAATMVTAGVYLLHRTSWLFALTPDVLLLVAWIGAITALMAAVLACVQDDIKRVLAYSTVSQLGYMMAAIGAGFSAIGFFHLLTHGLFKALLFLGAGAVIHAVGSNDLPRMGGLARRMPQTAIVFLVGTLSLAGIPLFAGFRSKEEILGAVWAGGLAVPVRAAGHGRLPHGVLHVPRGVPRVLRGAGEPQVRRMAERPGTRCRTTWRWPTPCTRTIRRRRCWCRSGRWRCSRWRPASTSPSYTAEAEFAAPGWLTPAAVGVAAAGILLAWLAYLRRTVDPARLAAMFGPIRDAALARFWIDDLFVAVYRGVILGLSAIVGWIDRYIVDGVLNAISAWTLTAGDRLRMIQTGRAQDYVYGVAVGVLALIIWMHWALA